MGGALKPLVNCFPELLKNQKIVIIVIKAFFKNNKFDNKQEIFLCFRQVFQVGDRGRGKDETGAALKLIVNCFLELLKSQDIGTKVEKKTEFDKKQ